MNIRNSSDKAQLGCLADKSQHKAVSKSSMDRRSLKPLKKLRPLNDWSISTPKSVQPSALESKAVNLFTNARSQGTPSRAVKQKISYRESAVFSDDSESGSFEEPEDGSTWSGVSESDVETSTTQVKPLLPVESSVRHESWLLPRHGLRLVQKTTTSSRSKAARRPGVTPKPKAAANDTTICSRDSKQLSLLLQEFSIDNTNASDRHQGLSKKHVETLDPKSSPGLKPSERLEYDRRESSDLENIGFLRFSPPPRSPTKEFTPSRPATPPLSDTTGSRLNSPSKKHRAAIPSPSLPEDLEGFWNSEVVNDWNDQYSPRKILASPGKRSRKTKLLVQSSLELFQMERKSSFSRAAVLKKEFDKVKQQLATKFLEELDEQVAAGKIAQLTAKTGGVSITWSKKLLRTAGQARCGTRNITTASAMLPKEKAAWAEIRLADKILVNEERLTKTLAHEFCHVAAILTSIDAQRPRPQPHGTEFFAWARKCEQTFPKKELKITRCHTYKIDYKYIWQCTVPTCAVQFKRQSRSIDPVRHRCGVCKSAIVQIQPKSRETSAYAQFVKVNHAKVRAEHPGRTAGEIMKLVAELYRTQYDRPQTLKEKDAGVTELQPIVIDDEDEEVDAIDNGEDDEVEVDDEDEEDDEEDDGEEDEEDEEELDGYNIG